MIDRGIGHDLAQLVDRLPVHRFLLIRLAEVDTRPDITRVHLQYSLILFDSPVILARIIVDPADVNLDDERERIELLRAFQLRERFLELTRLRQADSVPIMGCGVARAEFDGAPEFSLGAWPVP